FVPLWDQVAQGASAVAERNPAVHAAGGLLLDNLRRRPQVDRPPVAHPLLGWSLGRVLTRMLQKALGVVCHLPPFRRSSFCWSRCPAGAGGFRPGEPSVDETAPARDPIPQSSGGHTGRPTRWMPAQATRWPGDDVASRTKMWSLSARVKGARSPPPSTVTPS